MKKKPKKDQRNVYKTLTDALKTANLLFRDHQRHKFPLTLLLLFLSLFFFFLFVFVVVTVVVVVNTFAGIFIVLT